MNYTDKKIVVAIPCYNEEKTIKKVINDFRRELPLAKIVLFDNNSTDDTAGIGLGQGVQVIPEKRQGKGWVVRSIFEKLDADIYVLVDADATYLAEEVHKLIEPLLKEEADMVVGNRLSRKNTSAIRPLHQLGNWLITKTLNLIFRAKFQDVLSGYRVFTKEFVKNTPLITTGFEIETELTLQALEHGYIVKEVAIEYKNRLAGSISKLSTFGDGYQVMVTMAMLLRDHRPHHLFGFLSMVLGALSIFLIGHALRLGNTLSISLVLGIILMMLAFLFFSTGLILCAVNTRFAELRSIIKKNNYFAVSKEKEA